MEELTKALAATGATIAFDAIGGGKLASQILTCMEAAAAREDDGVQPLRLDDASSRSTSTAGWTAGRRNSTRNFGMAWSVGGWLLTPFLQKIGCLRRRNCVNASSPS